MSSISRPSTKEDWRSVLDSLPPYRGHGVDKIPAFFFPHGQPGWVRKEDEGSGIFTGDSGPNGRPVHFLRDFGRFLLERYQPRGIVVFSAHWETADHMRMVSNWGNESNPLLYDYFGFEPYMYTDVGFKSRGSNELSREVFDAFTGEGMHTHLSGPEEPRGRDGRGFYGAGLDHGVFVPFSVMFPGHTPKDQDAQTFGVPIVQASIDSSSDPKDNEAVGRAVSHLRSKGILVLSGGLTVHTFRDFSAFKEETAKPPFKEWDQAIVDAVNVPTSSKGRQQALLDLVNHPYCRLAHPELEHFMPLYVAAGAGNVDEGEAKMISGIYGNLGIAFY